MVMAAVVGGGGGVQAAPAAVRGLGAAARWLGWLGCDVGGRGGVGETVGWEALWGDLRRSIGGEEEALWVAPGGVGEVWGAP